MICVVGLGYVGLPLALLFSKRYDVIGYDIDTERIKELEKGYDRTYEIENTKGVSYTTDPKVISKANYIIVTVPTPIDEAKKPDLGHLISTSKMIGKHISKGSTVIFESTVYPGCTERDCVPVIEKGSGLKCGKDFFVGYSPERINPGDKVHTADKVVKVVSASDGKTLAKISELYGSVIGAGVFEAKSIMVAEAEKALENTQRDLNIALMNEMKMICDKVGIDVFDVIDAASTKWNFLRFTPGLVGGHCIGVDPYYLAYEAKRKGHHPEIILAGRRINDDMARYEAQRIVKTMVNKDMKIKGSRILILGASFKPNIGDMRNSKVKDLIEELQSYNIEVEISEPYGGKTVFGVPNVKIGLGYDLTVKAVGHDAFKEVSFDYELMRGPR